MQLMRWFHLRVGYRPAFLVFPRDTFILPATRAGEALSLIASITCRDTTACFHYSKTPNTLFIIARIDVGCCELLHSFGEYHARRTSEAHAPAFCDRISFAAQSPLYPAFEANQILDHDFVPLHRDQPLFAV